MWSFELVDGNKENCRQCHKNLFDSSDAMTVTLSPPHCYFSLSDLCDRRSCCVTANQLMTKFVCISCCATLPWAAAVLSMGVNVPRIFVNVPNARIFATAAGIVGCQRERPVDGSRMLATAFLSKPSRGRERNLPPPLLPSHGMHSHNP